MKNVTTVAKRGFKIDAQRTCLDCLGTGVSVERVWRIGGARWRGVRRWSVRFDPGCSSCGGSGNARPFQGTAERRAA